MVYFQISGSYSRKTTPMFFFSPLVQHMVISLAIPWSSISLSNMTGMLVRTENICLLYYMILQLRCRSQCPRGLRRNSAGARRLRLRVRFPPVAWMFVCCECCVLSLRRAHRPSRGVLPTVVRRCVWSRNLVNEVIGPLGGGGCRAKNKQTIKVILSLSLIILL